jgi:hypothetical protein
MGKIRVGNKQNSFLNGEWAGHVNKSWKRVTSGIRRSFDKKVIKQEIEDIQEEEWEILINESNRPAIPKFKK